MTPSSDEHVRRLVEASNLGARDWQNHAATFDAVLQELRVPSVDVVALSANTWGNGPLVIVCRHGVAFGERKGMLRARIDVQFFPYRDIASFVQDERGYSQAPVSVIDVMANDSRCLCRLQWGEAPDDVGGAARERDHILHFLLAASRSHVE